MNIQTSLNLQFSFLLLPLLFIVTFTFSADAQSFDEGLEHYQLQEFEEALEVFLAIEDDDRATLFAGKSYLALGQYLDGAEKLRRAADSSQERIRHEAYFSLALKSFQLKNYVAALDQLHSLKERTSGGMDRQASSLYDAILAYLTPRERLNTFWSTNSETIRLDLLESAARGPDPEMARAMLKSYKENRMLTDQYEDRINRIEQLVERSLARGLTPLRYHPPAGTVYHIGVTLPSFSPDDPNITVSRNLYSGLLFAAEEYNATHSDRRIFLRYRDTAADPDSIARAVHELLWSEHADAIIGPLFSDEAIILAELAEQYQVPVITPLANSDDINEGHQYIFQLNPTHAVHGREMARHAVQTLQLDTLAVITQTNTYGETSANAFRREAERLGAHIAYDLREDFAAIGYDLSEITEVFTQDQALIDSLGYKQVDAVYAPFTGQDSETLISQLLTDLELMGSNLTILGSEEWGQTEFTSAQRRLFPIYYTSSYNLEEPDHAGEFAENFEQRFGYEADEFARIGYDSGQILIQALNQSGNPALLSKALRNMNPYSGLAFDIHFDGTQINRRLRIEAATPSAVDQMDR